MAKFDGSEAIAFATQVAEGTFNATLDAIAGVLLDTDGLVLFDELEVEFARDEDEPAPIAGSLTLPMGSLLRRRVESLEITLTWCGARRNASNPPVDPDFPALAGVNALLAGLGMTGAAWAGGVGHRYVFAAPNPISTLLYKNGVRYELLDCRCTGEINWVAGEVPKLTVQVEVGSIKDLTETGLPGTLTYGAQATVSAPIVESVGFTWGAVRGFAEATLAFDSDIDDVPDSNAPTGLLKDRTGRDTTFTATLYTDDTDEDFSDTQLAVTTAGSLQQVSFQVGDNGTALNPVEAIQLIAATPVAIKVGKVLIGTKAAEEIELALRNAVANGELELIFR